MTITRLARNSSHFRPGTKPFPTFPASTSRLWDVTDWAMIDTFQGQKNWTEMDNSIAIAQQYGVSDFIFAFGRVPAWASAGVLGYALSPLCTENRAKLGLTVYRIGKTM
jgi:hypothetical protein